MDNTKEAHARHYGEKQGAEQYRRCSDLRPSPLRRSESLDGDQESGPDQQPIRRDSAVQNLNGTLRRVGTQAQLY